MQTQTIMVLDACSRCGQPIAPGEPAMQTASVDPVSSTGQALDDHGRSVSSPVKAYQLRGWCYEEHRRRERAEIDALRASKAA